MRKMKEDAKVDYQLLDRLKGDCEYSIKQAKSIKPLWGKTVDAHIAKMKELWNKLKEKPEWLSMKDINEFEKKLKVIDNKKKENVYIVDSEIQINEDTILEAGDKIRVLNEYEFTAKDVAYDAIENNGDWFPYKERDNYFNSDYDDKIEIIGDYIDTFFDEYEDEDQEFLSKNRNKIIRLIVDMLQK